MSIIHDVVNTCGDTIHNLLAYVCDWSLGAHKIMHPILSLKSGVTFFPMGKTNALRNKISSFQQLADELILEACERMQEYVTACPHHGMEDWLLI